MLADKDCSIFLTLAGSTSAGGCMNLYTDLVKNNMVDAIVATGASIIDMDFFEALVLNIIKVLNFKMIQNLRKIILIEFTIHILMKKNFKHVIKAICDIANTLEPRSYTSREFIKELGKFLKT
jgi:deoxyhypusine synthase